MQTDIGGALIPAMQDPIRGKTRSRNRLGATRLALRDRKRIGQAIVASDEPHFHRTGQREIGVMIEQMPHDCGTAPTGPSDQDRPVQQIAHR